MVITYLCFFLIPYLCVIHMYEFITGLTGASATHDLHAKTNQHLVLGIAKLIS